MAEFYSSVFCPELGTGDPCVNWLNTAFCASLDHMYVCGALSWPEYNILS